MKQAITCRAGLFAVYYRERSAYAESVREMREITSLGAISLTVIARDPALGSVTPDEGDDWPRIQQEKLQLSTHLVIATGSRHNVPQMRPDVMIAEVQKLVEKQRVGSDRRRPNPPAI